jgi:hypothetical protein
VRYAAARSRHLRNGSENVYYISPIICGSIFLIASFVLIHICFQVAKWEERGGYIESGRSEDVEARKLKHLTTKPCPKCGVRIEKSGGCPVRKF